MNRKSLLIISLVLILGISLLTGCGGGGGKKTPENSLSSDYFGLEVNYTRKYNGTLTNVEAGFNNTPFTWTENVLSEVEPGLYKTQTTATISGLSEIFGEFIEKNEDGKYYDRGWWEVGEEEMYLPDYDVIISNPVDIGFNCFWYGEIVRKESVTVPAGTFDAWVFVDTYGNEIDGVTDTYYYFVPHIGIVKETSIKTEGGEITFSLTRSLTSYYLSSSASSSSLVNPSVNISATSNSSLKLKEILKNKK